MGVCTQESENRLTSMACITHANAICKAANDRLHAAEAEEFGPPPVNLTFEDYPTTSELMVRFAEELLAELRALPPPEADRPAQQSLLARRAGNRRRAPG